MSEKKRWMGNERGRTEEKASPTLSGEGPKACANPSGWSRDPFGMESGTRTSGFLMQVAKTEHSHPLGMVVSTHFRCGKWVKRGLKNGALPFNID